MESFYCFPVKKPLYLLLGLIISLLVVMPKVQAQKTYATSQTNSVAGLCVLCGVVNPNNPVNNGNLNDYSSYAITVGLLGVSVQQTLIFPSANTNTGCDSLVIGVGSDNSLLTANLFAGIQIETYNGSTPNNDAISASSLVVRLLNANTTAQIVVRPTAKFDRVKITLTSTLVGALQGFRNYYAYYAPQTITTPVIGTNNMTICEGATATLTATTTEPGNIIDWYNAPTGGTLLFTGNSYNVTPNTTTTYYASTRTAACGTITRAPATVTVNPAPITPVVSVPAIVCPLTSAQLQITNPQTGVTYNWYSGLTDLIPLGTGTTYNTLPLAANTTFYLDAQVNATSCKLPGGKQAVNVVVKNIALPVIANTNITVCQGDTVTLNATSDPGTDVKYFDALTGGVQLFSGNNIKIVPTANTTLYATAGIGSCLSLGARIGVNITVIPRPVVPDITVPLSVCQGTPAVINILNPQVGATYSLYNSLVGGSPLASGTTSITTSALNNDTTLYLDAKLPSVACGLIGRIKIDIKVKKMPMPNVALTTQTICAGDSVNLNASTSDPNNYIQWFNTANGTIPLFTGSNYKVVPSVNTTYYAAVTGPDGCIGVNKVGVTVNVTPRPVTPNITIPVSVCQGTPAVINILNPQIGATYSLYNSLVGGSPLASGTTSITTSALNNDTTLYLDAKLPSVACGLVGRIKVEIKVKKMPMPNIAVTTQTICAGDTANLNASTGDPNNYVQWFNTANGTVPLFTGSNYKVVPSVNTTYYAAVTGPDGCIGVNKVGVTVNVKPRPITPNVSVTANICAGNTAVINILNPQAGVNLNLFDAANGGNLIATGNGASITTPVLNDTTKLFLDANIPGSTCSLLNRVAVTINVQQVTPPTITSLAPSICSGSSTNLTATTTEAGATIEWYTASTGGTPIGTGSPFTVSPSTTTTYYAGAKNGTCYSLTRTSVTVTVNLSATIKTIAVPATGTTCQGQSATLSVVSPQAGVTYTWYNVATGGSVKGTGTSFTTPPLANDSTYYLGANELTPACGFPGGVRVSATVTIKKVTSPTVTTTTATICSGSSTNLIATTSEVGGTIEWYTSATGGTAIGTGSPFTVSPTATTTYYAAAKAGTCSSFTRVAAVVTVNPAAITQTIVTPAPETTCQGQTATLTVNAPEASVTYKWYNTATGGSVKGTGNSFTTPALENDSTYYLEASVNASGCGFSGGTRIPATVTIKKVTTPTITTNSFTICSGSSAELAASTTDGTISWYTTATGGTAIGTGSPFAVNPTSTTTYYAGTTSGTCSSVARVSATVTVNPAATPQTINTPVAGSTCQGQTATLSVASPEAGVTYSWYNVATGGTAIATGNSFITGALISDSTFYLGASTMTTNCSFPGGNRIPATVNIKKVITPTLTSAPAIICQGSSATLTATTTEPGGTIEWYSTATGGTPIATGASYTVTPATNTTYYIATLSGACSSFIRVPAEVKVTPAAVAKTITAPAPGETCQGSSAILSVTDPQTDVIYSWFDVETGGTALGTGISFTTPILSDDKTFYLAANEGAVGNCGFPGGTRPSALITIKKVITPTITSAPATICEGKSTELAASTTEPGGTIEWYTVATGGTTIGTGSPFTVNPVASTTYYAATRSGLCSSTLRSPILVTVNPAPIVQTITVPAPGTICEGKPATLSVDSPQAGAIYNWYTTVTGGTILATGNSFTAGAINNDTTFYLEANMATTNCGFADGNRIPAIIDINRLIAPVVSGSDATVCPGKHASLTASVNTGESVQWYDAATGGNLMFTGSIFEANPSATTTYYAATLAGSCTSISRTPVKVTLLSSCPLYANNDSTLVTYLTPITINVTANDFAGAGILDLATLNVKPNSGEIEKKITISNQGEFIADNSGNITFSPASGFTGTAQLPYTLQNNLGDILTPGLFIATVGPDAHFDKNNTTKNTPVSLGDITINDIDVDGINKGSIDLDPEAPGIQNTKAIAEGTFTIQPDTTILFTPAQDFKGNANIKYVIKDKKGARSLPTEITVSVGEVALFIPQGFTPNGDGINDYFVIQGIDDYDVSVSIYNRWGNIIYGDNHYKNNWDGSLNKSQDGSGAANTKLNVYGTDKAPEGTYFYIIEFNGREIESKNGFIVIGR